MSALDDLRVAGNDCRALDRDIELAAVCEDRSSPAERGGAVMSERDLDVVVLGATGVTGRRIAEYLAERTPETGARWAAAARDTGRLRRVLDEEGIEVPETLVADISDRASLAAMAARAQVVLNAVGPFTLYAEPVLEACVEQRAHYADITGEIPFVRRMIERFHASATQAGIKIVQVCGWECLPADLALLLATHEARMRWGEEVTEADLAMTVRLPPRYRPAAGEGAATGRSLLAVLGDHDSRRAADPAALIPDEADAARVRQLSPISMRVRRGPAGAVLPPMVPYAFIGPPVIHRTEALLAAERNTVLEPVRYREALALKGSGTSLPLRWAAGGALAGAQAAIAGLLRASPRLRQGVAGTIDRMLPDSGYSPPLAQQREWGWGAALTARTGGGHEVRVDIESEGHFGYLATGRITGEAGLLLAEPGATPNRAGCLTPATALDGGCAERFRRAKLHFSVTA
jgi:short subunit dehydrogenase-like uncharacterized protein